MAHFPSACGNSPEVWRPRAAHARGKREDVFSAIPVLELSEFLPSFGDYALPRDGSGYERPVSRPARNRIWVDFIVVLKLTPARMAVIPFSRIQHFGAGAVSALTRRHDAKIILQSLVVVSFDCFETSRLTLCRALSPSYDAALYPIHVLLPFGKRLGPPRRRAFLPCSKEK